MSDKLTIEQRHRDAAADLIETYWSASDASMAKLAKSYRGGHSQGVFPRAFARFEASLRTPTPEQAGEVEECPAITEIDRTIATYRASGVDESMDEIPTLQRLREALKTIARKTSPTFGRGVMSGEEAAGIAQEALQSTPPAQPTADAVKRREAIARIVERSIGTAQRSAITGDCDEDYRHALIAADDILALPTMAGDYVMVPRVPTEAMLRAAPWIAPDPDGDDSREDYLLRNDADVREVWSAMLSAASPTGGE